MELDNIPMTALKAARNTFARIPMILVLIMTLSLLISGFSEIFSLLILFSPVMLTFSAGLLPAFFLYYLLPLYSFASCHTSAFFIHLPR